MDEHVPHTHKSIPRGIWVLITKGLGQVISGLAYNFYVFHYAIVHQNICAKVVQRYALDVCLYSFDRGLDVF